MWKLVSCSQMSSIPFVDVSCFITIVFICEWCICNIFQHILLIYYICVTNSLFYSRFKLRPSYCKSVLKQYTIFSLSCCSYLSFVEFVSQSLLYCMPTFLILYLSACFTFCIHICISNSDYYTDENDLHVLDTTF